MDDSKQLVCNECGAPDFSGSCATCVTMRSIKYQARALDWALDALKLTKPGLRVIK